MKLRMIVAVAAALAGSTALKAQTYPFTQPETGYSQHLFGTVSTSAGVLGGVAFAPNGDVWVRDCNATKDLFRFELAKTVTTNGTEVHPQAPGSPVSTPFACGMTNGAGEVIYLNTGAGVVKLFAIDGSSFGANNMFGPGGNSFGIAVDPQTKQLVYASPGCAATLSCALLTVDPVGGSFQTFATLSSPVPIESSDGVYFDPSGDFLFVAGRTGVFPSDTGFLYVVSRKTGAVIQQLDGSHFPDGVAVHINPLYLVANNNDATVTRYDFPLDDFTQAPQISTIASGGFRGDLVQVGPDNCLYLTQAGTRFANQTTSAANSVVRLCSTSGRFAAPPDVQTPTCEQNPSFWKVETRSWPVGNLRLGSQSYTEAESLALLAEPSSSLVEQTAAHFNNPFTEQLATEFGYVPQDLSLPDTARLIQILNGSVNLTNGVPVAAISADFSVVSPKN